MNELKPKQSITVFNEQREELGEGTFIRRTFDAGMSLFAYECEEHTILVRGAHFLRTAGEVIKVEIPSPS